MAQNARVMLGLFVDAPVSARPSSSIARAEVVAPSAANFLYCADSSYTEVEILQAERYVLKTLVWNMSYPNPIPFLRRVSKADEYNVQVRTIAKYLLEIQCLEWRLIAAPPSLLAASAIWLARLILGFCDWVCRRFS